MYGVFTNLGLLRADSTFDIQKNSIQFFL